LRNIVKIKMNTSQKEEAAQLQKDLTEHSHRYHVLDDPVISDGEYDRMMARLIEIETQNPALCTADSPTKRVGAPPLDAFESAAHSIPMLSLDNAFEDADVLAFHSRNVKNLEFEKIFYTAEPKLDGLAVELTYAKGILVRATTRGDGINGEVITENVRTVKSIPLRLNATRDEVPALLEVRGEVIIMHKDFERLYQTRLAKGVAETRQPALCGSWIPG
jgi:DNA ligase (NAD+)